jgi:hypothetical protein
LIEKGYARGDDYVTQSSAALEHHKRRQGDPKAPKLPRPERPDDAKREEELLRRQAEDTTKRQQAQAEILTPKDEQALHKEGIELTDAKMERLSRKEENTEHNYNLEIDDDPGRQRGAPGGGRTRSR